MQCSIACGAVEIALPPVGSYWSGVCGAYHREFDANRFTLETVGQMIFIDRRKRLLSPHPSGYVQASTDNPTGWRT